MNFLKKFSARFKKQAKVIALEEQLKHQTAISKRYRDEAIEHNLRATRLKMAVGRICTNRQLSTILNAAPKMELEQVLKLPDTIPHPLVGMRKCPCGMKGCDRFWLTGIGQFVEGSGFAEDDARDICEFLNKLPQFQQQMKLV